MTLKKIFKPLLASSLILSSVVVSYATSIDLTQLPLGDKKISTSPKVGYIYACPTKGGGGGAQTTGSWIHGSTWNLKEKLQVQGAVSWPSAQFTISTPTESGRIITGNGLPVGSLTGMYPIASTDPAYQVDRNPNTITTQSISYTLPTTPKVESTPSCVPMGAIGVSLNGVAIFNALDAENRDGTANEVQDICGGHPERSGLYHYHGPSSCLPHQNENNALVGYAIDGFGIYSNRDAQGIEISTKDLDECHGTTSEVMWDGKKVSMYHYVVTQDYPYTVGCLRGKANVAVPSQKGFNGTGVSAGTQSQSSASTLNTNLSVGSDGADVVALQSMLERSGYLTMPNGTKKGHFGGVTREALKKYQKANNIEQTGTFGPKTRALYNSKSGTIENKIERQNFPVKPVSQSGESSSVSQSSLPPNKVQGRMPEGVTAPNSQSPQGQSIGGSTSMRMPTPPEEAVAACDTLEESSSCSFVAPGNKTVTGTCREVKESLACLPAR